VVRVTGPGTRLIPATHAEQERLAQVAAQFSEGDLTRYLKLTLDTFQELQYSLQPRLHIEVGLVRLVQASRLVDVEEALEQLGGQTAPAAASSPSRPTGLESQRSGAFRAASSGAAGVPVNEAPAVGDANAPRAGAGALIEPAPRAPESAASSAVLPGSLKERLINHLSASGRKSSLAAIECAQVEEGPGGVRLAAPREFALTLRSADMTKAVTAVLGRPVKITVVPVDDADPAGRPENPPAPEESCAPGVQARALAHPEVQRFQELFPDSRIKNFEDLSNP